MTLAQLDRTIFELLRLELVAKGYLPNYPADMKTWDAALAAHTGTLIQIYGAGIPTNRGVKDGNRIVINRKPISRGMLGGNTPYFVEQENGKFTKKKKQVQTFNVSYEVRTVSANVNIDRVLTELILRVLGLSKYHNAYKDGENLNREFTESPIYFMWMGSVDIKATDMLETIHKYDIQDVLIGEDEVIAMDIPKLTKITAKIKNLEQYNEDFPNVPPTDSESIIE